MVGLWPFPLDSSTQSALLAAGLETGVAFKLYYTTPYATFHQTTHYTKLHQALHYTSPHQTPHSNTKYTQLFLMTHCTAPNIIYCIVRVLTFARQVLTCTNLLNNFGWCINKYYFHTIVCIYICLNMCQCTFCARMWVFLWRKSAN